jgi:hypothetical protein
MLRGATNVGTLVFVPDEPSAVTCTGLEASRFGTNANASGTLETTGTFAVLATAATARC